MATTLQFLKANGIDYLLASIEDGQLILEPFCSCGNLLDEKYHCPECNKVCECRMVACTSAQSLAIVERLVAGNPNFRGFDATLLDE
ncbi:MAG: hypothetical protein AAGU11_14765 [Syntrophobacteraceae bacterium]